MAPVKIITPLIFWEFFFYFTVRSCQGSSKYKQCFVCICVNFYSQNAVEQYTHLPNSVPPISNRPEFHLAVQTVYTVSTGIQRSEWQCVSFNRWRMLKVRKRCLYPTVQFVVANDRWCFVRSPVVLYTARNLKAWRRNFSKVQSRILLLLTPSRYFSFYLP